MKQGRDTKRAEILTCDCDEFEAEGTTICPACNSVNDPGAILGVLGNREHCRCRYCGAEYSHEVSR